MNSAQTASSEGALAAAAAGRVVDADAAKIAGAAVRVKLGELGVITAAGEDAARFLHGQLTGDVEGLGADRLAPNGYCSPKGRLLATFRIWRDDAGVHLLLPRELLPPVLKRLSMFVLRAKAKLRDDSEGWHVEAVLGPGATEVVRAAVGAVPEAVGDCAAAGGVRIARLHPSAQAPERFLLLAAAGADLPAAVSGLPGVDAAAFWLSEIGAGVPTVFAATQEKFVPQMINFEVIGGVSFSKGCYPGQEVVARSQYRGKLKRRMHLAHCAEDAAAGADVFADGEAEPVGTVVMSAGGPGGGCDLLFECPLEKAEAPLRLGAAAGPRLELRPLPYELVDVTA